MRVDFFVFVPKPVVSVATPYFDNMRCRFSTHCTAEALFWGCSDSNMEWATTSCELFSIEVGHPHMARRWKCFAHRSSPPPTTAGSSLHCQQVWKVLGRPVRFEMCWHRRKLGLRSQTADFAGAGDACLCFSFS